MATSLTDRLAHQAYRPLAGIVAGVSLLHLANAVFAVALPLKLALAGHAGSAAGLIAAAYGAGFLGGCVVAQRLIRRVGHVGTFMALAAACALLSALFTATDLVPLWFALRLTMGFCVAGLLTVVEAWVGAAAETRARGRVLAGYLLATKAAVVGGQLAMGIAGPPTPAWFCVAALVFVACLVPVALTRTTRPPPPRAHLLGPRDLYRRAPAAMVACCASGLLSSAVLGLVPVYSTRLGLPVAAGIAFLTVIQLGGMALQWPLGRLADRLDRRALIAGCAAAVSALSLGVAAAGERPALLPCLLLLWGGVSLSFYAVAVAHAGEDAEPDQMAGVSSNSLLAWAAGAAAGPALAAPLLDLLGPAGLFLYAAAVAAGLALFVLWCMGRRPPVPATALTAPPAGAMPGRQEAGEARRCASRTGEAWAGPG